MKKLKSLGEHNAQRRALSGPLAKQPNGIACPWCDKELLDSNPSVTLTSDPPQKNVECPACGYTGYRLA